MQCWGNEAEDSGDPPRLWAPNALYPGTAFTRSVGDSGAPFRSAWGWLCVHRMGSTSFSLLFGLGLAVLAPHGSYLTHAQLTPRTGCLRVA